MEASQDHWITSAIFEHACKENFEDVNKCILEDVDLATKVIQNSAVPTSQSVDPTTQAVDETKIKPVFLLVSLLKQMCSLENFKFHSENASSLNVLPVVLDLLDTTYKQFNFMSLKRYFTLTSELKLLDLLNLIVEDSESTIVVQKLNQHFPRWSSNYRLSLEKDFNIENSKVLEKVESSHGQCRRLILKLAVDKAYKAKYMSEQYSTDLNRLTEESKAFLLEAVTMLKSHAGSSVLEKILNGEELQSCNTDDLSVQLLLDYIQPEITSDNLFKYLNDFEPIRNSQPPSALTSCLLPFDTMSELSDDSDGDSESEYESSEDLADSIKPTEDISSSSKTTEIVMDSDD